MLELAAISSEHLAALFELPKEVLKLEGGLLKQEYKLPELVGVLLEIPGILLELGGVLLELVTSVEAK